jgi:glucan phosphoethanolaminetransferase (alkaline phosphatase superfamily)
LSVPLLLTATEPVDAARAASRPTVLAIAKAAGARTAWISNQETLVVEESGHDLIAQTSSSAEGGHYDGEAISVLADFAARNQFAPSRAVVVHLYGQHFHYKDRYPPQLFDDEPPHASADALQALRYSRAAEYGAKVLLDAAAVLDSDPDPAFLVFTSDHGENLPSDRNGKSYHTGTPGLSDSIVPVLVVWNRAFAEAGRAARLQALVSARGPIAHRDVATAWLALMGMPGTVAPTARPRVLSRHGLETIACDSLPG